MARKRVDGTGRFAAGSKATEGDPKREAAREGGKQPAGAKKKAPRPAFCRVFARARMAEAMPDLVETLLEEAGKGSLAHLKVLMQLSGVDTGDVVPQRGRRRGKSLEAVLKERWAADRLQEEQDRAAQELVRLEDGQQTGEREGG